MATPGADRQLGAQLLAVAVAIAWFGIVTLVAMLIVKAVFGARVTESAETDGLDPSSHGERAYN